PADCGDPENLCVYALDGYCDEPNFCRSGTDTADCSGSNTCVYAYNAFCDEPDVCETGTDQYDCARSGN
ncbi:MAG TPA: hypothetical protein VGK73_04355, partial [Polyangiaceae bacterium]